MIFDGYNSGPDIKDLTHKRLTHGTGPAVTLSLQTVVNLKKKDFLSNKVNNQNFLSVLCS